VISPAEKDQVMPEPRATEDANEVEVIAPAWPVGARAITADPLADSAKGRLLSGAA